MLCHHHNHLLRWSHYCTFWCSLSRKPSLVVWRSKSKPLVFLFVEHFKGKRKILYSNLQRIRWSMASTFETSLCCSYQGKRKSMIKNYLWCFLHFHEGAIQFCMFSMICLYVIRLPVNKWKLDGYFAIIISRANGGSVSDIVSSNGPHFLNLLFKTLHSLLFSHFLPRSSLVQRMDEITIIQFFSWHFSKRARINHITSSWVLAFLNLSLELVERSVWVMSQLSYLLLKSNNTMLS